MPLFDVHVYATAHIIFDAVEADSPQQAAEQTARAADLYAILENNKPGGGASYICWSEDAEDTAIVDPYLPNGEDLDPEHNGIEVPVEWWGTRIRDGEAQLPESITDDGSIAVAGEGQTVFGGFGG